MFLNSGHCLRETGSQKHSINSEKLKEDFRLQGIYFAIILMTLYLMFFQGCWYFPMCHGATISLAFWKSKLVIKFLGQN